MGCRFGRFSPLEVHSPPAIGENGAFQSLSSPERSIAAAGAAGLQGNLRFASFWQDYTGLSLFCQQSVERECGGEGCLMVGKRRR